MASLPAHIVDLTSDGEDDITHHRMARGNASGVKSPGSSKSSRLRSRTPISPPPASNRSSTASAKHAPKMSTLQATTIYKKNGHWSPSGSKSTNVAMRSGFNDETPQTSRYTTMISSPQPLSRIGQGAGDGEASLISLPRNPSQRTSDLALQRLRVEEESRIARSNDPTKVQKSKALKSSRVSSASSFHARVERPNGIGGTDKHRLKAPIEPLAKTTSASSSLSESGVRVGSVTSTPSADDSADLETSIASSLNSPNSEDLLRMFNARTNDIRSKSPLATENSNLETRPILGERERHPYSVTSNDPAKKRPLNEMAEDVRPSKRLQYERRPHYGKGKPDTHPSRAHSSRLQTRNPPNMNLKSLMNEQINQGGQLQNSVHDRGDVPSTGRRPVVPPSERGTSETSRNERLIPIAEPRLTFSDEDCINIVYLKEVKGASWGEIQRYFPHRSKGTLQNKYCKDLKFRSAELLRSTQQGSVSTASAFRPAPERRPEKWSEAYQSNDRLETRVFQDPGKQPKSAAHLYKAHAMQHRSGRGLVELDDMQIDEAEELSVVPDVDMADPVPLRPRKHRELTNADSSDDNIVRVPSAERASDFEASDSGRSVVSNAAQQPPRPYLSADERAVARQSRRRSTRQPWASDVLHEDFYDDELAALENVAKLRLSSRKSGPGRRLQAMKSQLGDFADDAICSLAYKARKHPTLRRRSALVIESFLKDVRDGSHHHTPVLKSLHVVPKRSVTANGLYSFVRQRELGHIGRKNIAPPTQILTNRVKILVVDTLSVTMSFTGLGNDVNAVAWDPEGNYFAAGAVCITDDSSMQYNRPRNLLFGNMQDKTLREFPHHHTLRQRTGTGANSTHAMHTTQDPRLFQTISALDFSANGKWMYTTGYDKRFRIWDVHADENMNPCMVDMEAKEKIDLMSKHPYENIVAIGSHRTSKSIKVIKHTDDPANETSMMHSFASARAIERPTMSLRPSSLKFEPVYGNLLLGGYTSHTQDEDGTTSGEVCVWDISSGTAVKVNANTRDTFDCSWSPNRYGRFAVGHKRSANANKATRTEVRIYDFKRGLNGYSWSTELENSHAGDINDVVFCPYDENYIAAGCTDGTVYLWDLRNPYSILYRMPHGKPLMERPDDQPREEVDEGVRFLSWGPTRDRLYSGSSDGVVRVWDVTQPIEQVFVKDLVSMRSGIMCGAFSPDKDKLLLGEVNGTISVLEALKEDYTPKDVGKFRFTDAPTTITTGAPEPDSAIAAARAMIDDKSIVIRPLGGLPTKQAVQGPFYGNTNLYDTASDAPALRSEAEKFQKQMAMKPSAACDIPACREGMHVTGEELGDSERSNDRIPIDLRRGGRTEIGPIRSGIANCSQCGSPARPRANVEVETTLIDNESGKAGILCERCDFSCFRCGKRASISQLADYISCSRCRLKWCVDALGYSLQDQDNFRTSNDHKLRRHDYRQPWSRGAVEVQDEMDELANYYHSLWIDRPDSPPL